MIRLISLFGLFLLSVNAQFYEQPQEEAPDAFYPLGRDQYEVLRNLEQFRRQQYERELVQEQSEPQTVYEEELRIPGERPRANDSYLCTAFKQLNEKSISEFPILRRNNI